MTRDIEEALRNSLLSKRQTAVCLKVRSLLFNRQFDEWNGLSNRSYEFAWPQRNKEAPAKFMRNGERRKKRMALTYSLLLRMVLVLS